MRLDRLELKAFGPFTDAVLDLSAGNHGLHVIYGPNEAGKTSALRAIEQVLFGIPPRCGDDFIHPYQNLRIGARLATGAAGRLAFVRRKGNANTLLADDGVTPLDDAALRPFLGGLDRELFVSMFGIDHPRLVQGGRQIIEGSGEVGQLLFAAGAGIADLQAIQGRLQKEAEALFASKAKNRRINVGLRQLDEAKKNARQCQLPGEEWTAHDQALREARQARDRVENELQRLQRELARGQRLQQALPVIAQWRERRAQRAALGNVVRLSAGFGEQRRTANIQREIARKAEQTAQEELDRLQSRLQALDVPQTLLDRETEIRDLRDALGSHRKAQRDLPGLQAKREQMEAAARALLREIRPGISLDMADELRLTTAQQVAIHDLGNRHEALERGFAQAQTEIQETEQQLADEQQQLQALAAPRDPAALKNVLQRAQAQGDLEGQLQKARADLRLLEQHAAAELQRLPFWSGTAAALETLPVPGGETVERFDQELSEAASRIRALATRCADAQAACDEIQRQLDQARLEGDVPTEQDLLQARQLRDRGWQLVRQAWQSPPIDAAALQEFLTHFPPGTSLVAAYEEAVREADQRADRLRREASRVASRAGLLAQREAADRQRANLEAQHAATIDERGQIEAQWRAAWTAAGIEPGHPRDMRAWLAQHRKLLQQADAIRQQRSLVEQLQQRSETHRDQLLEAFSSLGEPARAEAQSLAALVVRGQGLVERIEAATTLRRQLEQSVRKLRAGLAAAKNRVERAQTELDAWRNRWAQAVEPLGLPGDAPPAAANQVVGQLSELFNAIREAQDKRGRVEGILVDARAFGEQVQALARPIDPALLLLPADQAAEILIERLQKALTDRREQETLQKQRHNFLAKQAQARQTIAETEARLQTLCQEAGCTHPEALSEAERLSDQAARLEESLANLDEQLSRLAGGGSIDSLLTEAATVIADDLPSRLHQLHDELAALQQTKNDLSEAVGREQTTLDAMRTSTEATESAEGVQDILARLESDVQQYARLRLASAVLREGIERYRRQNEGPVLRRASELFRRLTGGRFLRLSADCDEAGRKILQGIRAGEGVPPVAPSGMSEGTADQLYLALRLASLESYLDGRESIPFIVDDILITFDDERAAAALAVLAEFSRRAQVIFFTHHAHLVELARQHVAADTLFVHPLAANGAVGEVI